MVVEAVVDPNEPPMPPKATLKQALHFAESLARGEPARGKIISTILEGCGQGDDLMIVRGSTMHRTDCEGSMSRPTRSPPICPKPTGRFLGIRRRSCSSSCRGPAANGIGFTYADTATARLIHDKLAGR